MIVQTLLATYRETPADRRAASLDQHLAAAPGCAVGRYLLGCAHFDRGRAALAVRQMMTAARREPALESASLLVFTGLLAVRRRAALLPALLETWDEFRQPPFDRTRAERRLLDALAEPLPASDLPPLARRFWRLPIVTLREQIRAAAASHDAALFTRSAAPA